MYLKSVWTETSVSRLQDFMRENMFAILTTTIPSPTHRLIQSTHLPWVLDPVDTNTEGALPRLRGHIARQNPQAKAIIEQVEASGSNVLNEEVMVLFNGSNHHYITPKFYTHTGPKTGKVAPTWNYSAVQAYGTATVFTDSKSDATIKYLDKQLRDLAHITETKIMGYDQPWTVDGAPIAYIEMLRKNIIGIEIEIHSLDGKFKMSQEKDAEDRAGVVEGLEGIGSEAARAVAGSIVENSPQSS